jgi:hypothetical protein
MRIMGRPRALVAVVAGALLLAGCGTGPSQVGSAAIVGDTSVSIDQVQNLIDKAVREHPYARKLADEHKLDLLGRAFVGQLVLHELLLKAAQQEGISPNYGQIDAQLAKDPLTGPVPANSADETQAVSQVATRARDHREELTDANLAQALADKTMPDLSVTFDYTSIGSLPSSDGGEPPQGPAAQKAAYDLARQFAADPAAATKRVGGDNQYEQSLRQQAASQGQNVDSIPPLTGLGVVLPAPSRSSPTRTSRARGSSPWSGSARTTSPSPRSSPSRSTPPRRAPSACGNCSRTSTGSACASTRGTACGTSSA